MKGTRGTETSKYPEEKKAKAIPRVVASEIGTAQTAGRNTCGVRTHINVRGRVVEVTGKLPRRRWNACRRNFEAAVGIRSTSGHEKSGRKKWGPSQKAKYDHVTDREEYREGKVKRTPGGEWNRTWNRELTSRESTIGVWSRTFCRTGRRVTIWCEVKC